MSGARSARRQAARTGVAAWTDGYDRDPFACGARAAASAPRGGHVTVKANVYGFWMGTLSLPMALCTSLMLTW
jgi:hypothetical protein